MKRRISLLLLLGLAGVPAALAAADSPRERAAQPAARATSQGVDRAREARRAKVYARVGDEVITVGDIEDAAAQASTFRPERFAEPARLRELAKSLVDRALLAQAAERANLDERPSVQRAIDRSLVQHFVRFEYYEPALAAEIPAEQVAAYYAAHEAELNVPALARASHILVDDEDDAKALIAQLDGKGHAAFQKAAREQSLDEETKLSGGDLRLFTRQGLPTSGEGTPVHPALVEAAFSLDGRGALYPRPIEVGERYSVLMLTQTRPAVVQSLEEATPAIRRILRQERRQEALTALLASLEARVKPVVHPETLAPITIDSDDLPAGLPPHPHRHGDGESHQH